MNPETLDQFRVQLADAGSMEECELVREQIAALHEGEESLDEMLAEADARLDALKREGREELEDEFSGTILDKQELPDGTLRLTAVVAQADKVNKNKRLYPRDEMVRALEVANRRAKRGSIYALAGHPSFFGKTTAADIVVKWERFMLKDKNIIAEGVTIQTEAGREHQVVWQSGVALEWSIRGYGRPEEATNKKGDWTHDTIRDYVLDGADSVLRGAATTRTVSLTADEVEEIKRGEAPADGDTTMKPEDKKPKDEVVEEEETPTPPDSKPEPKPVEEAKPPAIDVDAIAKEVMEKVGASVGTGAAEAATKAIDEALARKALADHKATLLTDVTDDDLRKPMEKALAGAATIEEADELMATYKPMLERAMRPEVDYAGVGIITDQRREKQYQEQWWVGGELLDRPTTRAEVKHQLLQGIEDTPSSLARDGMDVGNPRWNFSTILDQYERNHPEYLDVLTRRGIAEAATTTTAMGTITPKVLPIVRQLFPMLIPYDIAMVWPLTGPTGRIPTLTYEKSTGESLSDSAEFDSTWADHEQAAAKSQIKFTITTRDVTAIERAIYFDLTTAVIQDMRAVYNLDAEAELIAQASSEIARETNLAFIEMMLAQATAGNVTFGQTIPAGSNYTGQEWTDRFHAFIEQAAQYIRQNVYRTPGWVVAGPAVCSLMKSMKVCQLVTGDQIKKYGDGLSLVGNLGGNLDLYECSWLSNTLQALVGYRPTSWADAPAVYCPYVPMYVSPRDFTASTNTAATSVSARDAMTVLQPAGLSTLTITSAAGTDISFS